MNTKKAHIATFLIALATILLCTNAFAERKVIYVHGKNDLYCYNGTVDRCYQNGDYTARYWRGTAGPTTSLSAFYVGYNGTSDPRQWGSYVNGLRLSDGVYTGDGPAWNRAQSQIHAALWWGSDPTYGGAACNDKNNWCELACHSAGCYALDYYFAHFDPNWEAQAGTLNAYNIWAVSSATGGSELADHRLDAAAAFKDWSSWAGDERYWPMTVAMTTSQARSWNHNATAGRDTQHFAGSNSAPYGLFTDNFFGTRNDGALAFHSQCGYETPVQTNNCYDAGGYCAKWPGCPWYWPLCTQHCSDFRKYNHWPGHNVPAYGQYYGPSGWSTSLYAYDKTHAQMSTILRTLVDYFDE